MTRIGRKFVFVAGTVAGAVGLWALIKHFRREEEDRPPILVNNGSIRFRTGHLAWVPDGSCWKPDHANGRRVREFEVSVRGDGAGKCGPLTGNVVQIRFGSETFTVHKTGGEEPCVAPRNKLTHDPRTRTLSFGSPGSGMITELHVGGHGGGTCTFSSTDVEIKILPLH